jgi:tetratricopeptide (TPR) repeat protein
VEKALREGRFQQALELAKELYTQEPVPTHRDLLRQAYLGRGRQLREAGHDRDAVTVLRVGLNAVEPSANWLGQVAAELALCGEVGQALSLVETHSDESLRTSVLGKAVDAALRREPAGRDLLPEPLRGDFDRILQAFRQAEAGKDDAARETLQGISLRSPFLEWKVLLRGLQAYYQKDDARALENWQRLNPERLPARLAAPFRFLLDPAFRTAQPPATQTALRNQADRLQGSPLVRKLRDLQAELVEDQSLATAFRKAEALLPELRREAPQIASRLANCFYWAAMTTGPDDVPRYRRVFGSPPHDPNFNRLYALAYERGGSVGESHHHWQKYEKDVAARPDLWPAGQADRVRALIWLHLGEKAAEVAHVEEPPSLPGFLRDLPDRTRLDPPADRCFERALELAPDLLAAHEGLFLFLRDRGLAARAVKTARRLLQRYPDHGPTLEALGDLLERQKDYPEALELLRLAQRANPLDRRLRSKVANAHLGVARSHAEAGHFDQARAEYQTVLGLGTEIPDHVVHCRWAACEFKAGDNARAEELLTQARTGIPALAVVFVMVTESARLKAPRPVKLRFDKEFAEGLAAPPDAAAAVELVSLLVGLHHAAITYLGLKTHEKKILTYLGKVRPADFTEAGLEKACGALLELKARKQLPTLTRLGQKRFKDNPFFPYLEALSILSRGERQVLPWQIRPLLEKAERLARARPADPRMQTLIEDVQSRLRALDALNPFNRFFDDFLGRNDDDFFEEDEP